jgi:hypothetical protein
MDREGTMSDREVTVIAFMVLVAIVGLFELAVFYAGRR